MAYSVPRPVYEKLAETLKDRGVADEFARSIEGTLPRLKERPGVTPLKKRLL